MEIVAIPVNWQLRRDSTMFGTAGNTVFAVESSANFFRRFELTISYLWRNSFLSI